MTREEDYPNSSFGAFPYYFSENPPGTPSGGIRFGDIPTIPSVAWLYDYDLAIYYDTLAGNDFIDCRCSRWNTQNYSIIIETWLKETDLQTLRVNVTPGAIGELYTILGKPRYYDSTWQSNNTLRLYPTPSSNYSNNSSLNKMRSETLVYVKNTTTSPIKGPQGWINIKIEGMISGTGAL